MTRIIFATVFLAALMTGTPALADQAQPLPVGGTATPHPASGPTAGGNTVASVPQVDVGAVTSAIATCNEQCRQSCGNITASYVACDSSLDKGCVVMFDKSRCPTGCCSEVLNTEKCFKKCEADCNKKISEDIRKPLREKTLFDLSCFGDIMENSIDKLKRVLIDDNLMSSLGKLLGGDMSALGGFFSIEDLMKKVNRKICSAADNLWRDTVDKPLDDAILSTGVPQARRDINRMPGMDVGGTGRPGILTKTQEGIENVFSKGNLTDRDLGIESLTRKPGDLTTLPVNPVTLAPAK
ncbi:MAG: hypothetical protein U9N14_05845 [Pseudomonadota bacterium]|nr:hypothetical protein [Pseudomonadota bacterium]